MYRTCTEHIMKICLKIIPKLPEVAFKTLGKDKKILCLFLYNNLNKHLSRDDFNGEHLICRRTELIIGDRRAYARSCDRTNGNNQDVPFMI